MKNILQKDYSMIFWANEDRNPLKIISKVNEFLNQFGDEYVFNIPDKDLKAIVERHKLPEGDDKTVNVNYFSDNLMWFTLSTGIVNFTAKSYHKLPEVLTLKFDLAHLNGAKAILSFSQLQALFKYCVELFDPFYGRLQMTGEVNYSASLYRENSTKFDLFQLPITIEWFNYFGVDWVQRFGGKNKVLSTPVFRAKSVDEPEGIILILQEAPFDYKNPDHLRNRQKAEIYLDLKFLQQRYQKK